MAPNAIKAGSLNLISNYKPEEFTKVPKLIEKSAKVKQAKKGGSVYQKIGETSSKPPKPITAKKALEIIETIIEEYESLPKNRLDKRNNLKARESSVPGMTKREGWIAFKANGEFQRGQSCRQLFHPRDAEEKGRY
ncbi:hypothetical protein INS49_003814 [Diaporthe citri]|uniref:uncharacterized protein n=1 Tax=Diaporthe citri TaxID=83186 RepID=UPI001C802803|nr:uncharacterized protein INS49_003814 [Diaporthe citri]KAG6354733.1 hypothetical protein INS49_003814 [Diaporthe citri]